MAPAGSIRCLLREPRRGTRSAPGPAQVDGGASDREPVVNLQVAAYIEIVTTVWLTMLAFFRAIQPEAPVAGAVSVTCDGATRRR